MFIKFFGQLLVMSLLSHSLPMNVADFEQVVHSENFIPTVEAQDIFSPGFLPQVGEKENVVYPKKVDQESYGIITTSRSVLVQDRDSGMILLAEKPYDQRSIGSVTKLMTAMVFLDEKPNLEEYVKLQAEDIVYGGRIYLAFEDGLKLDKVLGASLVGSDNTATQSLMRFVGMDEETFVYKMNQKAEELEMSDSIFTDPTGIRSDNVSTANDLVKLLSAAEKYPDIQKYMQTANLSITHQSGIGVTIENTNKLLESYLNQSPYAIEGGKTGYLPEAGYVLATTVQEGSHAVHVIVMGSDTKDTRIQEAKGLASWAFKTFSWE